MKSNLREIKGFCNGNIREQNLTIKVKGEVYRGEISYLL